MKKKLKQLNDALYKKALGFTAEEVSEEYALVDNELKLSKRKLNTKSYPPDLNALQLLLEEMGQKQENMYDNYSLEELEAERKKLRGLLEKCAFEQSKDRRENEN